jgi:transcriptional regulator with XRE-family HTH domain
LGETLGVCAMNKQKIGELVARWHHVVHAVTLERQMRKLTQEELAQRAGVRTRVVVAFECMDVPGPNLQDVLKLLRALGLTLHIDEAGMIHLVPIQCDRDAG